MQADDLGGRRGGLFNADQLVLSEQMIGYWSRFAATGDPNWARAPRWPRYTTRSDQMQSLAPAATGPIATFAADHRCALWASLAA